MGSINVILTLQIPIHACRIKFPENKYTKTLRVKSTLLNQIIEEVSI